ncbi:MAG: class I SAM-dependent methyltransferase [Myxococcota bacterium]
MEAKIPVELGAVQETLLIPLLGRAEETRKPRGALDDPKSVEITEALDYDFDKWRGHGALAGASIRARLFDEEVQAFLTAHPEGTVVEIGAGLNTRYERLDNGRAQWLELDLPDSMALRRRFFEDTERRTMVAASVLDEGWLEEVRTRPGPVCFVAEAVLIYLGAEDLEPALRRLAEAFPGSWLVTDTASTRMFERQKHSIMNTLPKDAWFRWRCDDPAELGAWGFELVRSRTFVDAPKEIRAVMPMRYRVLLALVPGLMRKVVGGYRINRLRAGTGGTR